ncbi:uncharacterized protein LOC133514272 isoform X2 [Syngnathoides biaculeatus]|uniref:uncharacterized protein LOC133514272 isoform X2 n=1 Tax=Syngnathoides biaculeatus TaxID=300417 RepID=UPI002ADE3D67|nr:uncharacterized protein LOC133514272 isoform X2 [Syngnathoides biaculeatus]
MDLPGDEILLRLFHCSKTEMSCMENPQTFIRQLRDYDLIPEIFYKKVDRTKSKEALKKNIYDFLDWLERERPESIRTFWWCVLKETITNQYPALHQLSKSLKDGSFDLDTQPSKSNPQLETDVGKTKAPSEDGIVEQRQEIPVPKKKKQKTKHVWSEEEQPSQSCPSPNKSHFNSTGQEEMSDVMKTKTTSEDENAASREEIPISNKNNTQKNKRKCKEEETPSQSSFTPKKKKMCFSSPVKGGKNEIWTWPFYKSDLPVTCGNLQGTLKRDGLKKGEPSILFNNNWFTPPEFVKLGCKSSNKKWETNIRCMNTPLAQLLKDGHLQSTKLEWKSVRTCNKENSNHEFKSKPESEVQPQEVASSSHTTNTGVFNVTCGALAGKLYEKRFASGTHGKSIRTDAGWMTPADFMKEALDDKDASWKKDILWEGQSLCVAIQENLLTIHSLLCICNLCCPTDSDLEKEKNDDECCVCKSGGDLVVCEQCPRSFHSKCHLPHIDDNILSDNRPWMCTFCIFTTTQGWYYSDQLESDVVLSKQISKHLLECHYLLLCLLSADDEQLFATNPCVNLNDYSAVVKTPMWFCKIAEKIQKNDYCYVGEFVKDVQLIFSNSDLYNKDNPSFLIKGSRLKMLFDEEFKKAF